MKQRKKIVVWAAVNSDGDVDGFSKSKELTTSTFKKDISRRLIRLHSGPTVRQIIAALRKDCSGSSRSQSIAQMLASDLESFAIGKGWL